MQTDRGYSAIHFAAYHGNTAMCKYLIDDLGAKMNALTQTSQNVVHLAA